VIHDPDTLSFLRDGARKQIRSRMRALRRALPEAALAERSARIVARVAETEVYRRARALALFWPLSREVDLRALDERARADEKLVYYPVMDPNPAGGVTTGFALSASSAELAQGRSRFLEPPASAPRARRGELELVIVPALAVGADGNRLGYGGGFYDVTLPDFVPPATGLVVAYDFQLLAEIPSLPHDVPCRWIVTDARTLEATPQV
jgi:5-formyltetrahydrofolate cyclo-ligase